eukprot:5626264-Karenia_brevis.AAC.1
MGDAARHPHLKQHQSHFGMCLTRCTTTIPRTAKFKLTDHWSLCETTADTREQGQFTTDWMECRTTT